MSTKKLYSGNGLNQALLAAGRDLGLDPDAIAFVQRPKTHGFLRSPRVVIEVDPAAPRRERPATAPPERRQAPPERVARPAVGARTDERPRNPLGPDDEARIETLANAGIAEVQRTRLPYLTVDLNPAERRIVHLVVRDAGLVTESQGEGRIRPVRISLPLPPAE